MLFLLVGLISSAIGLIMYIVGIATPVWLTTGAQGQAGETTGLYKMCSTVLSVTACQLWGSFTPSGAFGVIGLLLFIPGFALACYAATNNTRKNMKIGGALIISAGLCGAIAAAIYTGQVHNNPAFGSVPPFGFSFILTWLQTVFTVFGGAAIVYAGVTDGRKNVKKERSYDVNT